MTWLIYLIVGSVIAVLLIPFVLNWFWQRNRRQQQDTGFTHQPFPTSRTFPPHEPTAWTRELPKRDETIGVDQHRPQRLHGLIEFQKGKR